MTYEKLFKTTVRANTVTITGVNAKPAGILVIPATLLSKTVAAIGANAFLGCSVVVD